VADRLLTRRYGTPMWDGLLRGTAALAALAAVLALCWKDAALLAAFLMITVWVHGPISPFLPAAYEPTLLFFGRLYPPLLIGVLGTLGNLYVEFLDYCLFRKLGDFGPYRRFQDHPLFARAVRLFARRPFLTVWLFAWSPLPDWMVRLLAPAARYPVGRYLVAMGLGRLPRFWLLAALGSWLLPPPWLLLAVALGSAALTVVALAWKTLAARSSRTPPLTLAPDARPTTA
jgi:ribonucleoside-triphosphate reductase